MLDIGTGTGRVTPLVVAGQHTETFRMWPASRDDIADEPAQARIHPGAGRGRSRGADRTTRVTATRCPLDTL
ncbi:hypothetical protein ADL25_20990 [Streptomyces sp. NRRL F-5122]|nr:hypothetical protein ADL25_20990 [Streptomyces sp. NRRL F-5122]